MDQIGVRVVLMRGSEVDFATDAIKKRWAIVKKHSVDKRTALGLREFGYRSVHLICRVRPALAQALGLGPNFPKVFELQIRSLLEHSWAEIEHGVVYKAGADLSDQVRRRFASLAGAMELLEGEFESLTRESSDLANKAKAEMSEPAFGRQTLDVPRFIAILETYRSEGRSFRSVLQPSIPGIETRIVLALRRCGIRTCSSLSWSLVDNRLLKVIGKYSAIQLVQAKEVAHLAVALLLIGIHSRPMLETFFPDFIDGSVEASLGW
jgi:hypothetical protein